MSGYTTFLGFAALILCSFTSSDIISHGPPTNYLKSVHKRDVGEVQSSEIEKLDVVSYIIQSDIKYRYGKTVISKKVINPAKVAQEAVFTVTLPESAFISEFAMIIKDKVYKAYVKEKEEAQKVYDDAKRSGRTAAHVQSSARDSNVFTVSVNIEPLEKVTFNLTYELILQRTLGVYENIINVNPGQVVNYLEVIVTITESSAISKLHVSDLKTENEITVSETDNKIAKSSVEDKSAFVKWNPSVDEQKSIAKDGLNGQIIIQYDVDRSVESSQILLDDGYFVHFFAPSDLQKLPKYLVFVLDVSGSMSGSKLTQLKEAMKQILLEVTPEDYFTVVTFSNIYKIWLPENSRFSDDSKTSDDSKYVVSASSENINAAIEFIEQLYATGGTNIIGSLRKAVELTKLGREIHSENEPIIFFLTDGEPNVEESNSEVITKEITKLNKEVESAIFSLWLGAGAGENYKFLQSLSLKNLGFAKKIYVASDISRQLKNFYKQIASPLLSKVTFKYVPDQVDEKSVTKSTFGNYFLGSEFVVAGKLSINNEADNIQVDYSARCGKTCLRPLPKPTNIVISKRNESNSVGHLERLWAYMYIKQMLDKDLISETKNSSDRLKALDLSLKYSFVTPLTSLVIVKPNKTESSKLESSSADSGAESHSTGVLLLGGTVPQIKTAHVSRVVGGVDSLITGGSYDQKGRSGPPMDGYRDSYALHMSGPRLIAEKRLRPTTTTTDRTASKTNYLSINDITWLNKTATTIKLPNSDDDYIIESYNPNISYQKCTSPAYGEGSCRYIKYCVLPEIVKSFTDYVAYSCIINKRFVGVCCPE